MKNTKTTGKEKKESSSELKIGKTIFIVTCIYSGDKKMNDVLENLVIEKMLEKVC